MTQMPRIRSSWNISQGISFAIGSVEGQPLGIDGLMGQNGNESLVAYAAHASATHRPSWHQPSAARGFGTLRASADPRLLPMPRPTRNTARINENV